MLLLAESVAVGLAQVVVTELAVPSVNVGAALSAGIEMVWLPTQPSLLVTLSVYTPAWFTSAFCEFVPLTIPEPLQV